MTAPLDPNQFGLAAFLLQHERKGLLRIVACGSVDHGKSTLLGRLLYETKTLFDDQLDSLKVASRRHGGEAGDIDYSLLLDGLAAEREQKITIDVAYRFFSTEKRKFIIADAPGHEQYTRNMATGASTADAALILVDAATGLTAQTKRHSLIVSMLGVRHFVVVVNKMDLAGWSEAVFKRIESEFRTFAMDLDIGEIVCIPTAARSGDNVVAGSPAMPWYRGPTMLEHLEQVDVSADVDASGLRMPVQWVNRPHAGFRGYSGLIAAGSIRPGTAVRILPAGTTTTVDDIVTYDGNLDDAVAGQSVTLTFTDDVDVSRGDVIASIAESPAVTDRLAARVVWMGKDALAPGRAYLLKLGTTTATARVEAPLAVIDLDTRRSTPTDRLVTNEIGACTWQLDRAIAADDYRSSKATGSFILIDPENYDTVGMGFVVPAGSAGAKQHRNRPTAPLHWQRARQARATSILHPPAADAHLRSVAKAVSWRAAASLATFLIALAVTGSTAVASSVAVADVATKLLLYYCHERIWSLVPWGRGRTAAPRT